MKKPKSVHSVYDNEYDNESWIGKREVSFSTKLLVALGGITSFGGLFPMVVEKISSITDSSVGAGFFFLFSLVYFAFPLVIFSLWVWLTERIAYPKKENHFLSNWSWKKFKEYPITYRYMWLVWLHVIIVTIYLFLAICVVDPDNTTLKSWLTLILAIAPILALGSYFERDYSPKRVNKNRLIAALAVGVFFAAVFVLFSFKNRDINYYGGYDKLDDVDLIGKNLASLENQIINLVDRSFILSSVQAEVTLKGLETNFQDSLNLYEFDLSHDLKIFNSLLLGIDDCCDEEEYPLSNLTIQNNGGKTKKVFLVPHNPNCKKHKYRFLLKKKKSKNEFSNTSAKDLSLLIDSNSFSYTTDTIDHKKDSHDYNKITNLLGISNWESEIIPSSYIGLYIKEIECTIVCVSYQENDQNSIQLSQIINNVIDTSQEIITNPISIKDDDINYYNPLFIHPIKYFEHENSDPNALIEVMTTVNTLISDMMNQQRHRVFPSCFDEKVEIIDAQSIATNLNNDSLTRKINSETKEQLAATINRHNSALLKDWVELVYLPYCQRKARSDISQIIKNTTWIWKDMQVSGIVISIASLILLIFFYLELAELKTFIIYTWLNEKEPNEDEATSKSRADRIADLNKRAGYLLFPLTMAITIISVLLIPITAKNEITNITPTKSFSMMNLPTLSLPQTVEDVVSNNNSEENDNEQLSNDKIESLQLEIKELIEAVNNLSSSLKDTILVLNEDQLKSVNEDISNNKKKIKTNQKEIEVLKSKLKSARDSLNFRIDNTESRFPDI